MHENYETTDRFSEDKYVRVNGLISIDGQFSWVFLYKFVIEAPDAHEERLKSFRTDNKIEFTKNGTKALIKSARYREIMDYHRTKSMGSETKASKN